MKRLLKNKLTVTVIALITVAFSAGYVFAGTVVVDQDGFATVDNCNDKFTPADAATINEGIAAASEQDTVIVCPGIYSEEVGVNKAVTVRAAKSEKAVVIGQPYAFIITADGAAVERFDARSSPEGGGDVILVIGADNVTVRENKITGAGPCVVCEGTLQPAIPNAGVSLLVSDNAVVLGNNIRDTTGFGIYIGSATNSLIKENHIKDSQFTGIVLADWEVNGPSSYNVIEGNRIKSAGDAATIRDDGIRLDQGANNNSVRYNHVTDSVWSGIKATASASDNDFIGNKTGGSEGLDGNYDAFDQSSGSGTSGTANFWSGNECLTQSPAGICE
ncbi:MAG: right-handed parallel beta-helix repeat-containing protein [Nitrospirota bacterium]|nr:right-handed parallel beta-helix repeat-containing protein [Nitrospirota bacterium]